MAERNRSKQRRQARNRAAREAREARAKAASMPVEERRPVSEDEAEPKRRPRRRRARASQVDVQEKARAVIEATASDEADETGSGSADSGAQGPAAAAPRRGSSPVFSASHRAEIAATTADRAPARTHIGVSEATGVEVLSPRSSVKAARSSTRSGSATPARSGSTRTKASNPGGTDRSTPRSDGPRAKSSSARPASRSRAAGRGSTRPPARPLPPFFDRFGGNEPGGRWVMMSFAMVLLASIIINFVHIVPEIVEIDGKQEQTGQYFTIWHYGIGPGLYFLLPPVIIFALFILTARPWDRRRSWNIALASLVFITFITQSISIYLVPLGALAWGCWQARKAALDEVGGDPRVLREVERERRIEGKEAMRAARGSRTRRDDS